LRSTAAAVAVIGMVSGLCLASAARTQQVPATQASDFGSPSPSSLITIPDGTAVEMRFAQPVRALMRTASGLEIVAHRGDKIRLVAAEDVRVNQTVVIAKGAIGQASVDRAWRPMKTHDRYGRDTSSPQTGLSLRLDWIEDVTGEQIPLRASAEGKSKPFVVEVLTMKGGMVARPNSLRRDMFQAMTLTILKTMAHELTWVPTGTRITGYAHGGAALDPAEVKQALSLLPIPNANAVLTVYRTKGGGDDPKTVSCDEKDLAPIGPHQYTSVELTPAAHACRVPSGKPVEITAEAGEEYFLEVHYKKLTSEWELQSVPISEGEDKTAGAQPIAKEQHSTETVPDR
jgi:hypothetical protein